MDVEPFISAFRDTNQQIIKLLDFLSALRGLSTIDIKHSDEHGLIESALRSLIENQDLERCSIYLCKGDTLVNVAGMDWFDLMGYERKELRSPVVFRMGEGMIGQVASEGRVQHCRDTSTDERFVNLPGATGSHIGSLISVPIRLGEETLGVLNASHPLAEAFGEEQVRMLTLFADFLAQMLISWRVMHRMDEEIRTRTAALKKALEEAQELKRRYERLSVVDDLTELYNRRFFFPETQAALARALRHHQPFSLLMIDLDHFKHINDDLGHAAGDEVLRQFAWMLRELTREGDILARFGGEEFVLALPNTTAEGACGLAERLRAAMDAHHWDLGNTCVAKITASIGISALPSDAQETPQELIDLLIRNADIALYRSKDTGRDRCTVFGQD